MNDHSFNADVLGRVASPDPIADVPKSTLHTIWVLDEDDAVACALSNLNPGALPFMNDLMVETLEGVSTYDSDCPGNHTMSDRILAKRGILIQSAGMVRLFSIETIDESQTEDGTFIKKVHCESSVQELIDAVWQPVTYTNADPSTILADLLTGMRWQPGTVEDTAPVTIAWTEPCSRLEALKTFATQTGLETSYRVEVNGARITGRYVDMVVQMGQDTGKILEAGKDIRGITRTTDATGLKTALEGVGKDGLTFAAVVWVAANGDPCDKPAGQTWVGDEVARQTWGLPGTPRIHRMGLFTDSQEASATDLLMKTWQALQVAKEPAYTYDITPVWIEAMGPQAWWQGLHTYEVEAFGLGDTIYVRHNDFTPAVQIETRVRELHRSFSSMAATSKVVLGTRRPLITDV